VGALYVRRKPRVKLEPLFSGGGQERGLRSGTLAPHLAVGLGVAAQLCIDDFMCDSQWVHYLSEKLKK
jgi:cysteine desulfurase